MERTPISYDTYIGLHAQVHVLGWTGILLGAYGGYIFAFWLVLGVFRRTDDPQQPTHWAQVIMMIIEGYMTRAAEIIRPVLGRIATFLIVLGVSGYLTAFGHLSVMDKAMEPFCETPPDVDAQTYECPPLDP